MRAIAFLVLPTAAVVSLVKCLTLSESKQSNVAIFLVATALALGLGEAVTRLHARIPAMPECDRAELPHTYKAVKASGKPFDTRTKLEVIEDLKSRNGEPVWPMIPPLRVESEIKAGGDVLFPLAGISRSKTVFCNETGEYVIYVSDEHGFRNPPGL